MTTLLESPVTRVLLALNISYELIVIPMDEGRKPIRALDVMFTEQQRDPGEIVRSELFRTGAGHFVLLAVAGGKRADWAILRQHLHAQRLALAEPDEVLEVTGFPMAAVPPIALPENLPVLADSSVFTTDRVVIGSGVLGFALDLSSADLRKAMDQVDVGHFVS